MTVSQHPDIKVTKTADPTTIHSGETVTWNITVENTGAVTLYHINVTDDLSGTLTDPLITLAPGAKAYYEYTTNPTTTTTNTVNVNGTDQLGTEVTNSSSATVTVIAPAITVTKNATPTSVQAGQTVTWNITVKNTGDVTLHDVYVMDSLQGSLGSGLTLAPDGKLYYEYSTNPTVDTTNTVEAGGWDPLGTKVTDTDSASITIYVPPELTITKSDSPDPIQPGQQLTYTVVVRNVGSVPATSVVVREQYDANFVFTSATPAPDTGFANKWTLGTLAAGASRTITIRGTVADNGQVSLFNRVTVTAANAATRSDTETTTVVYPDIGIDKDGPATVQAGGQLTYTLTYYNPGGIDLTNVRIVETYPPHTSFVSALPRPTTGNNVWDIGTLKARAGGTITITLDVDSPLASGTVLTNFVEITCDQGVSDNATLSTVVESAPHLVVEKSDDPDPVEEGGVLTYTIRISNLGNDNADNLTLIDDYNQTHLTVIDAHGGTDDGDTITWTIPSLPGGSSLSFNVTCSVNVLGITASTVIYNVANVTDSRGHTAEDVEPTTITPIPVLAEPVLTIEKTDSVDPVEPTFLLTYTIVVSNIGQGGATNVMVVDTLPDQVVYRTSSRTPVARDGQQITWSVGDLAPGESRTITVRVKVRYGLDTGTVLNNTVTTTCDEGVTAHAWETTTITNLPPETWKKFHGEVEHVAVFWFYLVHYIPTDTTITLETKDYPQPGASGVNHTYYRIWRWNQDTQKWVILFNWREYHGEHIDLAQLGQHYGYSAAGKYEIEFYSIDRAGNREQIRWNDVIVYEEA
ncbi:MAG: hypothetical protein PHU95_06485 [Candidatus Thermoplasmatota archaeon]|nr:hypothetical protein [Candidatus Thermoplasmatota archaeon]